MHEFALFGAGRIGRILGEAADDVVAGTVAGREEPGLGVDVVLEDLGRAVEDRSARCCEDGAVAPDPVLGVGVGTVAVGITTARLEVVHVDG